MSEKHGKKAVKSERSTSSEQPSHMESGVRRQRELELLRVENKRLKIERGQFLNKIQELQAETNLELEENDAEVVTENELLRAQLAEHKELMLKFLSLSSTIPQEALNSKHFIYKQGAESAKRYVEGLISESQSSWLKARLPSNMPFDFEKFTVHYRFRDDMFGEYEQETKSRVRLNLRIDCEIPQLKRDVVADGLWDLFTSSESQRRVFDTTDIELTPVPQEDMPDENTKVVYFRRKWEAPMKDQDSVFVATRETSDIAKSTVAVPTKANAQGVGGEPSEFGEINATTISLTSTTMHSGIAEQHSLDNNNTNTISSMIVKGGIVWEEKGGVRMCVVYSIPEEYRIMQRVSFSEVVNGKGELSKKFSVILQAVASEFKSMLLESATKGEASTSSSSSSTIV